MHEGHAYMQQHAQKQHAQVVYPGTLPVDARGHGTVMRCSLLRGGVS